MTKPRKPPTSARAQLMLAASERVGIDAKELAHRLGVDPATVHRWFSGARRPQGKQMQALTMLGITAEQWEAASIADGEATQAPPLAVSLEPGRWRPLAARYGRFARAAQLALAAGAVNEGVLDVVADALGVHKGEGPTDDEIKVAMKAAMAERDAWAKLARDATGEDFGEGGDDA